MDEKMKELIAIGFSIPLAAFMLGISLGKVGFGSKEIGSVVRWIAGILLLIVGFYFIIKF